jgi:hypothetical protein
MPNHAFRIHFRSGEDARERFEGFMDAADWITHYARKRDGSSHVVLLRECPDDFFDRCVRWCGSRPGVVDVHPISEAEFWSAPSHGV